MTLPKMLNALLELGFTEGYPGGILCSTDPILGGIIDKNIPTGKWFVIFMDERFESVEDLETRDEAIALFLEKVLE